MYKEMSIRLKLILGFAVVIMLLIASLLFALERVATINGMMEKTVQRDWRKAQLANEAAQYMNANAQDSYALFFSDDLSGITARIDTNRLAINRIFNELQDLVYLPQGKALLAQIHEDRRIYVQSYQQVGRHLEQGEGDEARRIMQEQTIPALTQLLSRMQELVTLQNQVMQDSALSAREAYLLTRTSLIVVILVSVIVAVLLASWIIRSVTQPLGGEPYQVKALVERVARGDLCTELQLKNNDDFSLMAAMAKMQASLKVMVGELTRQAQDVAGAAVQLSVVSQQIHVSSATQTQASHSMAVAMEEMSVNIQQVSGNAAQTLNISGEMGKLSSNGKKIFGDAVENMHGIASKVQHAATSLQQVSEHTQGISGIVALIRAVAEQTNMLALNAAIEAARAGEQGRGFAVVADEVRQLAERTASATLDIASRIEQVTQSVQSADHAMHEVETQVQEGVGLADQARDSMQRISDSTTNVLQAMNEITDALREQNSASNEITSRIDQVASMSHENHQAIKDVSVTAVRLEQLAAQTLTHMHQFQI